MSAIRYPVFIFDGDDLGVYKSHDEHWNNLEAYDVDYPEVILDSDGRLLTKTDAGGDRVALSDLGLSPNPERLRTMLIHALRVRGQVWDDGAPLGILIAAAQALDPGFSLGAMLSGLLRRMRLRR
jgi:hypothetical protein